jgi:hypothetical protein
MIPNATTTNYTKTSSYWLGTVINVNDPLQLGRVQVRINGMHTENVSDIPNADLPWAHVMTPSTEGGVSGIGLSPGIKAFAQVMGIFLDGPNGQSPVILGSLSKIEFDENKATKNEATAYTTIGPVVKPDGGELLDQFNLTGNTNIERAWNWFLSSHGGEYTPPQVAGILGNLWVESYAVLNNDDIDPRAVQRGGSGYGLAQWTEGASRFIELERMSKQMNMSKDDLLAQLLFITFELNFYPYYGMAQLRETTTPEDASDVFMDKYERPGDKGSRKVRREMSRKLYNNLTTL